MTVGVIWNVWHQWQLLAPGGAPFEVLAAASSLAYQVSASILIAWIYNSTGASLPSAIAAHVGLNAVRFSPDPAALVATVFVVAAALVVIVTGPVSLVRRGATPPDPLSPPSGRPAPPPDGRSLTSGSGYPSQRR